LSNDGATLYVPVKSPTTGFYAYLLGLDATNLATKYKVSLHDPVSTNYAGVLDDSTASPTIGPDGDVFFGIVGNQSIGRGFLLHFSADLQTNKLPGAFGWDYTPVIVPASIVPAYSGPSSYLLFSKYNNYAGFADGDGVNRIALLDPNSVQIDSHPSAPGLAEMREVLTVTGATPDENHQGQVYPYAVEEWCINTGAVNPATRSIFAPSEDGHIYRWNIASNAVTQVLSLGPSAGSPYVPTMIGPDGVVYTIHSGKLFALGGLTNLAVSIYSSHPDIRNTVAGQAVTFTAIVTNLADAGPAPTGTVRVEDLSYNGPDPVTNILADNLVLTNGMAAVTTSNLSAAGSDLGNHFITVTYSGDTNFAKGSATLVQKIHSRATLTALTSALSTNGGGDAVTFTATVSPTPLASSAPSGMVSFWDRTVFLGQTGLDTNGVTAFTKAGLSGASHAISATYSSDTINASSSASLVGTPPYLRGTIAPAPDSHAYQLSFTNVIGAPFTVLRSTDITAPGTAWTNAGRAIEIFPGQFQFSDDAVTNGGSGFYRVRAGD
jgi:hypothetical protein